MLTKQQAAIVWLLAHALATGETAPELRGLALDVLSPVTANCQPKALDDDHGDRVTTWAAHPVFTQMVDAGLVNAGAWPQPEFVTLLDGLNVDD